MAARSERKTCVARLGFVPRVGCEGVTLKQALLGGALAVVALALLNDVMAAGAGAGVAGAASAVGVAAATEPTSASGPATAPPTADMISDEPLIGPVTTRHE